MKLCNLKFILLNLHTVFWLHIGIVDAILGGSNANEGQFRYQVVILANDVPVCGGGIIGKQHVLSAAHCFVDSKNNFHKIDFSIVTGVIRLDVIINHEQKVAIDKIYIPREFSITKINLAVGDIAVLKLKNLLNFENKFGLSKLRIPRLSITNIATVLSYEGEEPFIAGYGADHVIIHKNCLGIKGIEGSSCSVNLQFAKSKVVSNNKCSSLSNAPVFASRMCAQIIQKDSRKPSGTCKGDSGGPLVLGGDTVIGVLSFGPNDCDESTVPAIYTRVTSFLDFIDDAVENKQSSKIRQAAYNSQNILTELSSNQ